MWKLCIFLISTITVFISTNAVYTKNYRKCLLQNNGNRSISEMQYQYVTKYKQKFAWDLNPIHRKKLEYVNNEHFVYQQYLGAGGSGQVYIIEHEEIIKDGLETVPVTRPKIAKRYFKEDFNKFEEQYYIMDKLKYGMQWMKYSPPLDQCQKQGKQCNNTISLYPFKNAQSLNKITFQDDEYPLLFYKIARQLQMTHRKGIIHCDLKPGNILLIKTQSQFQKSFEIQLIDWNLASFYYPGIRQYRKKGTPGFYPPQQLFRTNYLTPAGDIYSLGVTFFQLLTRKKPYFVKMNKDKTNQIQTHASLYGISALFDFITKYRFQYDAEINKSIANILAKQEVYLGVKLKTLVPQQFIHLFDDQLVNLLSGMLELDPQKRLTIVDVLQHKYFNKIKKFPKMYEQKEKEKKKRQKEAAQRQKQQQLKLSEQRRQKQKQKQSLKQTQQQKNTKSSTISPKNTMTKQKTSQIKQKQQSQKITNQNKQQSNIPSITQDKITLPATVIQQVKQIPEKKQNEPLKTQLAKQQQ